VLGYESSYASRLKELTRQFRDLKRDVDMIIPAWASVSPSWRFFGIVNWFVVRQVLVVVGDRAELSTCWTGWPTKVKTAGPVTELRVVKRGRRYDRMSLRGRRFWIAVESREALSRYLV
jgi:hypothetical protein